MKILGRNVVIGTKKICIEYTSKIQDGYEDYLVGKNEYKGKKLEENVLFVRDKKGYLIELKDLETFPTLSLICFGATTRWNTAPRNAGDYYVDEIEPYFTKSNQESLFELNTLIKIIRIEKSNSQQEDVIY